ncbi:hypothetical protein Fot_38046 [Forsythia ovata]|uniref:Uncharacterized protein n=1 Tax=Forsythia ovata TaxID=205694 RepID=A0ABD1S4Q6_9LAMI
MGPRNQGYKTEVKEVTHTMSKTKSKVSTSQPRSKFCRIHWSNNHDTEECPDVRATIDKMVENRYRPTGRSQMGQPSQPRQTSYTYNRGRGRGMRDGGYRLVPCVPQQNRVLHGFRTEYSMYLA